MAAWIDNIVTGKALPAAQVKLKRYKEEVQQVLYAYFLAQ